MKFKRGGCQKSSSLGCLLYTRPTGVRSLAPQSVLQGLPGVILQYKAWPGIIPKGVIPPTNQPTNQNHKRSYSKCKLYFYIYLLPHFYYFVSFCLETTTILEVVSLSHFPLPISSSLPSVCLFFCLHMLVLFFSQNFYICSRVY